MGVAATSRDAMVKQLCSVLILVAITVYNWGPRMLIKHGAYG